MSSNAKDGGELTGTHLQSGPVPDAERSCTDIICLLIFVAFSAGMFGIAVTALKLGDPKRLAQPYDPDNRACGVDAGVEDYPLIYFANPTNPKYLYITTCVKECPKKNSGQQPAASNSSSTDSGSTTQFYQRYHNQQEEYYHDDESEQLKCATNSVVTSCKSHYDTFNPMSTVIIYNSQPYMGHVCLPVSKDYFQQISSKINPQQLEQYMQDVKTTKWVVLGSIALAFLASYLFMFFVEKCAGVVVWLFLLATLGLLLGGGVMSYLYYLALTNPDALPPQAKSQMNTDQMQKNAQADNVNPEHWKYIALTLFSMSALFVTIMVCFFSRISLAIAILKTAGDFVDQNPIIQLLPVVSMIGLVTYCITWTIISLNLYSTGTVTQKPHQLPFGQFSFTTDQKYMANFHLFGLFWILAFIMGTVEFIIAGAVCNWYFEQGGQGQSIDNPTRWSMKRFLKFHVGSVAVGSFLLAVINFIRFWLEYIAKNQEALAKKNQFLEYFMKCMICCLWYFEKVVQYINKNAYININMTGKSFFPAAAEAIGLIIRNPIRFALVGGFGEIFVAVGRASISLMTGLMCYVIITRADRFKGQVQYPEAPTLLCAVVGLVIGSNFMAIYGTACDTMIFIFSMEEEMGAQNGTRIQCPERLKAFLEK